jgi:hypothetical protein
MTSEFTAWRCWKSEMLLSPTLENGMESSLIKSKGGQEGGYLFLVNFRMPNPLLVPTSVTHAFSTDYHIIKRHRTLPNATDPGSSRVARAGMERSNGGRHSETLLSSSQLRGGAVGRS